MFLLVVLIVVQLTPRDRNQSDQVLESDFLLVNNTPENIGKLLQVSCYDCHSNKTKYPWYNKVQPVAWFLEDYIKKGKEELNFSEWSVYSDPRKNSKLNSIISQIRDDERPLSSYILIHRATVLSKPEKELFKEYMKNIKMKLE